MRHRRTRPLLVSGLLVLALLACDRDRAADPSAGGRTVPAGGVVDSALPIPELLARFRATIPDTPTALTGGETSPERLTRALLRAVGANDTAAVRALTVSRAEFAWLYYPETRYTRPPYELGPELVWLTATAASEKGASRLFQRYGGRSLRFERLTCPDSTDHEGPNAIVRGCRVRFAASDSAARELRLFGALLHRDGRYKFLSFANDL